MQDLLVEVDRLDRHLLLLLPAEPELGLARSGLLLEGVLRRLQRNVVLALDVVDVESVVVRARERVPAPARARANSRKRNARPVSLDAAAIVLRAAPVVAYRPSPEKQHSNLSKMQSFS